MSEQTFVSEDDSCLNLKRKMALVSYRNPEET